MKIELNVPTDLNEITLSSFQKYIKLFEDTENKKTEFLKQKAIEIFCGVPLRYVANMRQIDLNEIYNKITKVLEQKSKLKQTFILNDIEFGFIPNIEDMTAGEYMDLDTYIQSMDTMHKALSVLYRPIKSKFKGKYLIEDYEGSDKYCDILKESPMAVATGASLFFWNLGQELLSSSMNFLEQHQTEIQTTLDSHNSGKNGDGTAQFMEQLKAMLDDSMILQN